jgi:hypothetical protein
VRQWFDFEARTKDNVELKLGLTFFWRILDVQTMLAVTGTMLHFHFYIIDQIEFILFIVLKFVCSDDSSGDVCSHARSLIIQAVSQVGSVLSILYLLLFLFWGGIAKFL